MPELETNPSNKKAVRRRANPSHKRTKGFQFDISQRLLAF